MIKYKRVQILLEPATYERLRRIAFNDRKSMSQQVRELLNQVIEERSF